MLKIGQVNQLAICDETPFGLMLGESEHAQVLLREPMTTDWEMGDKLSVFVYPDADGRLLASLDIPSIQLNQCALLKVKGISEKGAWLNWGLQQDLFVPQREMSGRLDVGMHYLFYLLLDSKRGQLIASNKLHNHLAETTDALKLNQKVDLIVWAKTDMGVKAIINNAFIGLIFKSEIFKPLRPGDCLTGYIKHIREDRKIDLTLQRQDASGRQALEEQILEDLHAHGGISTLTDKSPAEQISQRFNVSKSAYKKALGALYKQQKILLSKEKVVLKGG